MHGNTRLVRNRSDPAMILEVGVRHRVREIMKSVRMERLTRYVGVDCHHVGDGAQEKRSEVNCASKYFYLLCTGLRFVRHDGEHAVDHTGLHGRLVDALREANDALHLTARTLKPGLVMALLRLEAGTGGPDVDRVVRVSHGDVRLLHTWQISLDSKFRLVLHCVHREACRVGFGTIR